MKEKCFDIGTIQAFLDGELAAELLEKVACHVAACDDCALLLSEAENESVLLSEFLEPQVKIPVPSERLREKIFTEIAVLESQKSVQNSLWQKFTLALGIESWGISLPMVAGFASIILVVGLFAVVSNRQQNSPIAKTENKETVVQPKEEVIQTASTQVENETPEQPGSIISEKANSDVKPTIKKVKPEFAQNRFVEKENFKVIKANTVAEENKVVKTDSIKKPTKQGDFPSKLKPQVIEGEEDYLQTIAGLKQKVDANKDVTIRPSVRVSFERDLAMADNAINAVRKNAQKNPKDQNAKRVLFNAYQNKIDILNSVSEKTEVLASFR